MRIGFALAALTALLFAGVLPAQSYTGHPDSRVRFVRAENAPPNEIYTENRVIVTYSTVELVGEGMQISGTVVTDFEADKIPAGSPLAAGQLRNVQVSIELYYHDNVIVRDKDGKPVEPRIETRDVGRLVEGQSMVVTTNQPHGIFSKADFRLPVLRKPLAPGLYRLMAVVRFRSQTEAVQQAIKYCSDWYGVRTVQEWDPVLKQAEIVDEFEVMSRPDVHEEVYQSLMVRPGLVSNQTLLWIGEVVKDGRAALVSPEQGNARNPANYVTWSYHLEMLSQLLKYEHEFDNADAVVDADLALRLKTEPRRNATPEEIQKLNEAKEQWKKDAAAEKIRIKRDNQTLIQKYGGRSTRDELRYHTSAVAAKTTVLDQIIRYHEYLQMSYWILVDGHLQYSGWNSLSQPAYNADQAFVQNDILKSTRDRMARLERLKEQPGGLEAVKEKRRLDWQYQPPEVRQIALTYLADRDENAKWDANKFVKKSGSELEFDSAAWAKYRDALLLDFVNKTNTMFRRITTTELYAVQTWPQALAAATSARDDILMLAYSWEFYILTDKMKLSSEEVLEMWRNEPDIDDLKMSNFARRAAVAPGVIKPRFDGSLNSIRSDVRMKDFAFTYSQAIQRGEDARRLPGVRPPSGPKE